MSIRKIDSQFPLGVLGLEDCRAKWMVLLADAENDAARNDFAGNQSAAKVALAVASPRRFCRGLPSAGVAKQKCRILELSDPRQAQVLVIVGKNQRGVTLNLKATLVINLERRSLGRQVISNSDYPIQYELTTARRLLKTA